MMPSRCRDVLLAISLVLLLALELQLWLTAARTSDYNHLDYYTDLSSRDGNGMGLAFARAQGLGSLDTS